MKFFKLCSLGLVMLLGCVSAQADKLDLVAPYVRQINSYPMRYYNTLTCQMTFDYDAKEHGSLTNYWNILSKKCSELNGNIKLGDAISFSIVDRIGMFDSLITLVLEVKLD